MSESRARPTVYRGVQMRSRLEATFAAMFDRLGWTWEYEPRAYAGLSGQYLPDFQITMGTGTQAFVEVKPTVDQAYGALRRVQIIRESIPDAFLVVMVAKVGWFDLFPGDTTWRWTPFMGSTT